MKGCELIVLAGGSRVARGHNLDLVTYSRTQLGNRVAFITARNCISGNVPIASSSLPVLDAERVYGASCRTPSVQQQGGTRAIGDDELLVGRNWRWMTGRKSAGKRRNEEGKSNDISSEASDHRKFNGQYLAASCGRLPDQIGQERLWSEGR